MNSIPKELKISLFFPICFLNGWLLVLLVNYLQPLLSLFAISIILAIVLDFPIRFLENRGLARALSTILILLLATIAIAVLGLFLIPGLIYQISQFIQALPDWIVSFIGSLDRVQNVLLIRNLDIDFEPLKSQIIEQITGVITAFGNGILGLILGSFSGGLTLFFILILTIFLLVGGQSAWNGILSWLPPWWQNQLRQSVPVKFRKFIGGQVTIAVGFSLSLVIIFSLMGVPFSLLFGFAIGMASLFPFMGAISQISVSLVVMLQDVSQGIQVFAIALILGQILDNAIVPKVMGNLIGVNPIWLLFSVFMGAKLAGFVGILLAVPVASIIKEIFDELLKTKLQQSTIHHEENPVI